MRKCLMSLLSSFIMSTVWLLVLGMASLDVLFFHLILPTIPIEVGHQIGHHLSSISIRPSTIGRYLFFVINHKTSMVVIVGYGKLLLRLNKIKLISIFSKVLGTLNESGNRRPYLYIEPPTIGIVGWVLNLSHHPTITNNVVGLVRNVVHHCAYSMVTVTLDGKLYFT